jgi:hypothetical protein
MRQAFLLGKSASTAESEASLSREQKQAQDDKTTVWVFVWTLFVFKIVTLVATFWAAAGSMDAAVILMATNWFWIAFPMFAIWGPLVFYLRKRRVRGRREAMLRAEWMLE